MRDSTKKENATCGILPSNPNASSASKLFLEMQHIPQAQGGIESPRPAFAISPTHMPQPPVDCGHVRSTAKMAPHSGHVYVTSQLQELQRSLETLVSPSYPLAVSVSSTCAIRVSMLSHGLGSCCVAA